MYHEGRTASGVYAENAGGALGGAAVGTQIIFDLEARRLTLEDYTQAGGTTPSFSGQAFIVFPWDLSGHSERRR